MSLKGKKRWRNKAMSLVELSIVVAVADSSETKDVPYLYSDDSSGWIWNYDDETAASTSGIEATKVLLARNSADENSIPVSLELVPRLKNTLPIFSNLNHSARIGI